MVSLLGRVAVLDGGEGRHASHSSTARAIFTTWQTFLMQELRNNKLCWYIYNVSFSHCVWISFKCNYFQERPFLRVCILVETEF